MSVQLTQVNKKRRKRFTAQQKLEILREWEATGNGVEVAERHGIHPMTLYRWRRRLEQGAAEFLKGARRRADPRVRELERENAKLKEALALQAQELMLLKKKMSLV
jgi:transposase-like protein